MLIFWVVLVLATGLLAGIYPAFVLSNFKPIKVLRSAVITGRENTLLRKVLVVFQLVISTILIMGTIVISLQLSGIQNKNLGFDKDQILTLNYAYDGQVQERMEELRTEFMKNPAVSNVTFSRYTPGTGVANWYLNYEQSPGEMTNGSMYGYLVDFDFIDTYGLEIVAGRSFDKTMSTDLEEAFIVNEAAAEKMGAGSPEEAIGKEVDQFGKSGKIIGVVKDFNFRSFAQRN